MPPGPAPCCSLSLERPRALLVSALLMSAFLLCTELCRVLPPPLQQLPATRTMPSKDTEAHLTLGGQGPQREVQSPQERLGPCPVPEHGPDPPEPRQHAKGLGMSSGQGAGALLHGFKQRVLQQSKARKGAGEGMLGARDCGVEPRDGWGQKM